MPWIIRQINLELIQNEDDKFIDKKVIDLDYVEDFFKDKPKMQVKIEILPWDW